MYSGSTLASSAAQRRHRELSAGRRGHIRHQALLARLILARHRHGLLDPNALEQLRFDLPELDPKPPQLDLPIVATQKLDVPIGAPAPEIPRAVQARARYGAEGIGHEALGGQFGSVQIPAPDPGAADVNLAGHPDRHRLTVPVQNVNLRVRDRPADRDRALGVGYTEWISKVVANVVVSVGP